MGRAVTKDYRPKSSTIENSSARILLDIAFFLFYRRFHDRKEYSILNIENKQNCLFVGLISGYQAKLPYM